MSEDSVPQQGGAGGAGGTAGQPKGLLQQMEELMASLNADLSALKIEAGFSPEESKADQPRSDGFTIENRA